MPPSTSLRILLLMGTSHGYSRLLMDGMTQYLHENGHIAEFEFRGINEPLPLWVKDWEGDGILVRDNSPATFRVIERMGIPSLRVHCPDHPSDLDTDEDSLAEMVYDYFASRGFQHFAFYTQCHLYWTRRRRDAFVRRVGQAGKKCHLFEQKTKNTPPFFAWSAAEKERFIRWLHELPKPVALLAAYDFHARVVLDVCHSEKIPVPNEIAVLGVTNEEWFCNIQNPPLSSVIVNGLHVGREAARILCDKIKGKEIPPLPLLFPPIGIQTRRSTDRIAVEDEDMVKAMTLLRDHACQGITIEEIVGAISLSRRTLERKFKRAFGRTPGEELLSVRLERARELLRSTTLPIGKIAFDLSFCSLAYFVYHFRRKNGLTPQEYRNRNRC
ncbi:MAG: substrate-binding domain-containing protein [Planctomycetia bacterium]|nr:substrate-binding domain-containing protein [Planctomycetia bacterium]